MRTTITPVYTSDLYLHYQGENDPQPVNVELDLKKRSLSAAANGEVGNAVPSKVWMFIRMCGHKLG